MITFKQDLVNLLSRHNKVVGGLPIEQVAVYLEDSLRILGKAVSVKIEPMKKEVVVGQENLQ